MFANIFKYGAAEALARLLPFATSLYIAKLLVPIEYGKFTLTMVAFEAIFILVSLNIQATTRIDYFRQLQPEFNQLKQNHLLLALFLAFFIVYASYSLDYQYRGLVRLIALAAFFKAISAFLVSVFQCEENVRAYNWVRLITASLLSLTSLLFVLYGYVYRSWVYALSIVSFVELVLCIYAYGWTRFTSNFLIRRPSLEKAGMALVSGLVFMPQAIGWWLKTGADRFIISGELGDVVVAEYALAYGLASLILVLAGVINLALVPTLNRSLKMKDHEAALRKIIAATFVVILGIIVIVPFGSYILSSIYSEIYPDALSYFYPLAVILVPQAVMLLLINVLYFELDGRFVAILLFSTFVLQALANLSLIGVFGIEGIIVSSGLVNIVTLTLVLIRCRKIMKKSSDSMVLG